MAEADQEEVTVALEGKHLAATERTSVLYATESDSVVLPLLDKHQGRSDDIHKSDTRTETDGADRKTSVPQELELAGRDECGCSGSVRSLCSDSSRRECPICSELFDSQGEHRAALLNCNHTLCHHCIAGILRRAKDPSRLQCPFCRQTTPFPQWEIRRLQEELYSCSTVYYDPGPSPVLSPEAQTVPASTSLCCFAVGRQLEERTHTNICGCCVRGLRLMRLHSLCFSITALLLLLLLLLGCFLYVVLPVIMLPVLLKGG